MNGSVDLLCDEGSMWLERGRNLKFTQSSGRVICGDDIHLGGPGILEDEQGALEGDWNRLKAKLLSLCLLLAKRCSGGLSSTASVTPRPLASTARRCMQSHLGFMPSAVTEDLTAAVRLDQRANSCKKGEPCHHVCRFPGQRDQWLSDQP